MWWLMLACAGRGEPAVAAEPAVAQALDESTTWVTLHQEDGPLSEQLAAQSAAAIERGQIPVAYLGASWCPPCVAFKKNRGAEPIRTALEGVALLEIDTDAFLSQLPQAGFDVKVIPYWFRLDEQGRPVDEGLTGDGWKDLRPATVGGELAAYLRPE